jgi:hypothetical protein
MDHAGDPLPNAIICRNPIVTAADGPQSMSSAPFVNRAGSVQRPFGVSRHPSHTQPRSTDEGRLGRTPDIESAL